MTTMKAATVALPQWTAERSTCCPKPQSHRPLWLHELKCITLIFFGDQMKQNPEFWHMSYVYHTASRLWNGQSGAPFQHYSASPSHYFCYVVAIFSVVMCAYTKISGWRLQGGCYNNCIPYKYKMTVMIKELIIKSEFCPSATEQLFLWNISYKDWLTVMRSRPTTLRYS